MDKSVHSPEQKVLQELLKELRKKRDWRQVDLANLLEKNKSFVCRYEKGNVMLDMPQLRQVAHVLGLTLREMVDLYENALEKEGL